MIYAVVNTKGGVGKTTTAVHLATMLSRTGTALLIDGDPQASAASWAAWRRDNPAYDPSPTTTCLTGKAIFNEGKALSGGFDNVVVDVGERCYRAAFSPFVSSQSHYSCRCIQP